MCSLFLFHGKDAGLFPVSIIFASVVCNDELLKECLEKYKDLRKGEKMSQYLLISDAAKEVRVESHVLRYWEEELRLPIKRNELGHRYYTEEDVAKFKQIKDMKERGLQLKAIKMILKDGKLDVLSEGQPKDGIHPVKEEIKEALGESMPQEPHMAIDIVNTREMAEGSLESREEKSKRLQWLLQQLIRQTLQENNKELCREIKESVVKELDYQFRAREERDEERERIIAERNEEYYKKMDELLRKKSHRALGRRRVEKEKKNEKVNEQKSEQKNELKQESSILNLKKKKKRHFI